MENQNEAQQGAGHPGDDEIEALLREIGVEGLDQGGAGGGGLDEMMRSAGLGDLAAAPVAGEPGPEQFPALEPASGGKIGDHTDLLMDVALRVKIELGRSQMAVKDILRLERGSIVELDRLAGDPLDIFVNNRLVAKGEILVINDNFCIRITEIVNSGSPPPKA